MCWRDYVDRIVLMGLCWRGCVGGIVLKRLCRQNCVGENWWELYKAVCDVGVRAADVFPNCL